MSGPKQRVIGVGAQAATQPATEYATQEASSGQAPSGSPWLAHAERRIPAEFANANPGMGVVVQAGVQNGLAFDITSGKHYDPTEWVPTDRGLVRRCQAGRFDDWTGGRQEQCPSPAARLSGRCATHGGVPVAKQLLQDAVVPVTEAMIEIALDPREKTSDRLAAMNSIQDRAGGLGRTVAQPEPEVRSALLARIEQAAQEYLDKQDQADTSQEEAFGVETVVAVQGAAELEGPVGER